jgi:hypothetical protein
MLDRLRHRGVMLNHLLCFPVTSERRATQSRLDGSCLFEVTAFRCHRPGRLTANCLSHLTNLLDRNSKELLARIDLVHLLPNESSV